MKSDGAELAIMVESGEETSEHAVSHACFRDDPVMFNRTDLKEVSHSAT